MGVKKSHGKKNLRRDTAKGGVALLIKKELKGEGVLHAVRHKNGSPSLNGVSKEKRELATKQAA